MFKFDFSSKRCEIRVLFTSLFYVTLFNFLSTTRGWSWQNEKCVTVPKFCPNVYVNFFLYTREQPNGVQINETEINNARFNKGPIKMILHGYKGHKERPPMVKIRSAYLEWHQADINIIHVDFGRLVKKGCYWQSFKNTYGIAMCIAHFLDTLLEVRTDVLLHQIHIIGFSLGAHVAGQIRNYLQHDGQIERITALEAALPLFDVFSTSSKVRLNRGDAKFIDVVHTNGGMMGKLAPIGDVDFYANGGILQPGCGILDTNCSHVFSTTLFAESINPKISFWTNRCNFYTYLVGFCGDFSNTWTRFGEYVDLRARGSYFFKTTNKPPYAISVDAKVP